MKKRKIGIAAVLLLLLIGGTVWALMSRSDAQLEKVKQMQKEMANLSPDERRQRGEDLRKEMGKLTPEARAKLWDERRAERRAPVGQENQGLLRRITGRAEKNPGQTDCRG